MSEHIISQLDNFKDLKWDDESEPPSHELIEKVKFFLSMMATEPQHIAPGHNGEVMVEFKNGSKSFEILFYPESTKYVDFTASKPTQGVFFIEMLYGMLNRLYSPFQDIVDKMHDIDPEIVKVLKKRFMDLI